MKVAVIGAGIVGTTTAFELAQDGHEVRVFERRGAVAEETSFANAGVLAPGYVTPWAAPGMRWKGLKSLWAKHAPVKLRLPLAPADLAWMWRWSQACTATRYLEGRVALQRLAFYSRERWHTINDALQLEYDRSDGYLVLLRGKSEKKLAQAGLALLAEAGVKHEWVDETRAREIEPALSAQTRFEAAIHLPDDAVANCRQFAQLIKDKAQGAGVRFEFRSDVLAIETTNGKPGLRWQTFEVPSTGFAPPSGEAQTDSFDAVVVCAGSASPKLLAALGVRTGVRPVYGYSISAPIREPMHAPRSGVMDERYKVSITRLGQRVRVAGSAELGGDAQALTRAPIQTLFKVLEDWFPGAAQMRHIQEWKGARPMTPHGLPCIGPIAQSGIWLNLGHGSSGWALACGSARLLADQLIGKPPAIDSDPYLLRT